MNKHIDGIPPGWELVRIGAAQAGEYFISTNGSAIRLENDTNMMLPIIRKIEPPEGYRWVGVDEFGNRYASCPQELKLIRRVEQPKPEPPELRNGYRLLSDDEETRSDDIFYVRATNAGKETFRYRKIDEPLQLVEGGWYERRDGKVVGPATYIPTLKCFWVKSWYYKDNGERFKESSSDFDLIRRVDPPLRKIGELTQPGDQLMNARGEWVPCEAGRVVHGGWVRKV